MTQITPIDSSPAAMQSLGLPYVLRSGPVISARIAIARFLTLACLAMTATSSAAAADAPKALIEFGWDEPDTAYLRAHLAGMERNPFDGCVFRVHARLPDGTLKNFTWEAWGRRAFSEPEVAAARADLKAIKPVQFRANFLRFNTTPGDVDWFDDFAPVLANARLAASLARDGGARGILLDTEQYQGHLFDYAGQPRAAAHSFDECAEQARIRGRAVMDAFQAGQPGLTVLLTFGPSLPRRRMRRENKPLADVSDALLVPFVRGLVEAARGDSRIVDGFESSYGYREPDQFRLAAEDIRQPLHKPGEPPVRTVDAAFGLWLDFDWRERGWDANDPSRNYFTPESFASSLRAALDASDRYVWIYSETPRWWDEAGRPKALPPAYADAIRKVRIERSMDLP
ncbi:hypothetical protein EP7_001518 [Isosphaeraceae bacterium EP7]